MTIRYMNARGEEASLADSRALAFKVQLGEIDANTLMFDQAVGAWVPAARHPAFQVHLDTQVSDDSVEVPDPPSPAEPNVPVARGGPAPRTGAVPPVASGPSEALLRSSVTRPATSPTASKEPGAWATGPTQSKPPVTPPESDPEPELPPVPVHPPIEPRSASRRSGVLRVSIIVGLLTVAGAAAAWVVSPGWGMPGWLGTASLQEGDGSGGRELIAAPVGPSPRAEAAGERVARAVVDDLAREFTLIPGDVGLPSEPPAEWLGGRYLSAASQYPALLDYWDSLRSVVQLLRAREASAIHSSLVRHLAGLKEDEGPRDVVEDLALTALAQGAARRASVYEVIEDLAAAATDLHAFLLRWESRIEYEPASGSGASRAPVIEAVAEGEVLRVEFAAAIDRVLEALEAANGLEPMHTLSFFHRLAQRFQETLTPLDVDTAVKEVTRSRTNKGAEPTFLPDAPR